MTVDGRTIPSVIAILVGLTWAAGGSAQPLTADKAVEIALRHNGQVVNANAGILDARSGVYGAYSGVLPRLSAGLTRTNTVTDNQTGGRNIGGGLTQPISSDFESHGTSPSLSGSWNVLDLSGLRSLSSAHSGLRAARLRVNATRNDVALATRRQFYDVVSAIKLAEVATNASSLARDDERRVHALFEVGSVSRSDLLKAQVRTAQSVLDSLTAHQAITTQRIALATQIGMSESELGEVDTVLTVVPREYDEAALVTEAGHNRPDLRAAEADLRSARAAVGAARLARLPYVTASAQMEFKPNSRSTSTINPPGIPGLINPGVGSTNTETNRTFNSQLALNWNVFDGFATDSRVASARAQEARARETRDALQRNLAGEVHEALLAYREANARYNVAASAQASASENVKLTQQKYNVGSATILELIDAQVSLERAASDLVSALAAIRVAEAQLERVRGHGE